MKGLSQMKDLYKLQKEARRMQKEMKKLKITGQDKRDLVTITINGLQEIEEIDIADELLSPERKVELVKAIKEALKDANKRVQREMAKNMDLNDIKSMFGA